MSGKRHDPWKYALTRSTKRKALLSPRYALGRALQAAHDELVAALGGDPSPQQRAIIGLAVRAELLVSSYDHWLIEQPDLTTPQALAVVATRRAVADSLVRHLQALGLERRQHVKSLDEWMANLVDEPAPDAAESHQEAPQSTPTGQADSDHGHDEERDA